MLNRNFILLVVTTTVGFGSCGLLPSYVKKCKFGDDNNFVSCVMDNVPAIKQHIKNGIKELNFPALSPFKLKTVQIQATRDLSLKLNNIEIINMADFDIKNIDFDPVKQTMGLEFFFKRLEILSEYEVDGKILILPIKGRGPANLTVEDFTVNYKFGYVFVDRGDKQYLSFVDPQCDYAVGNVALQIDNLFGGDKALGEQVNAFINENWRDIAEEWKPSMIATIIAVVTKMSASIASSLSIDELFEM